MCDLQVAGRSLLSSTYCSKFRIFLKKDFARLSNCLPTNHFSPGQSKSIWRVGWSHILIRIGSYRLSSHSISERVLASGCEKHFVPCLLNTLKVWASNTLKSSTLHTLRERLSGSFYLYLFLLVADDLQISFYGDAFQLTKSGDSICKIAPKAMRGSVTIRYGYRRAI